MDISTFVKNSKELEYLWNRYSQKMIPQDEFLSCLDRIKDITKNESHLNRLLLNNVKNKRDYNVIIPRCFTKPSPKERKLERDFLSLVQVLEKHPTLNDDYSSNSELEDYNRRINERLDLIGNLRNELFGFYFN